jgi:hypothetical protein
VYVVPKGPVALSEMLLPTQTVSLTPASTTNELKIVTVAIAVFVHELLSVPVTV